MNRLLQAPWFVAVVGAVLYLTTTAALVRPELLSGVRARTPEPTSPNNDPSWKFRNPEFEQWISELKQEKQALDTREQQLRELQTRLQAERQEILSVTQAVHQLQVDFEKTVIRFKEQEVENIKKQAKIVSGMSPEGAAAMLREMQQEQMIRILFSVKPDVTSAILDALSKLGRDEAKRAADAAERVRQVLPPETKPSRPAANS